MTRGDPEWMPDFPLHDEVEDFAGKIITVTMTCDNGAFGVTVRARKEGAIGSGCGFGAYSETSIHAAPGRVREKMRRALATRHISGSAGAYQMHHDELRGRITSDGARSLVLIVDGCQLSMDELAESVASHEGFDFELRVRSGLE